MASLFRLPLLVLSKAGHPHGPRTSATILARWPASGNSFAAAAPPAASSVRAIHGTFGPAATYRRFGQPAPGNVRQPPPPHPGQRNDASQPLNLQSLQDLLLQRNRAGGGGGGGRPGKGRGFSSRPPTIIVVILGGAGIYYVLHLERVPQTGRWRFIDVGRDQEIAMGRDSYRQILQEYRGKILPPQHPHSRHVRKVAARIISALDHESSTEVKHGSVEAGLGTNRGASDSFGSSPQEQRTEWEVFVIDEPSEKNAFVLPGGKIFVFTGILPICSNEDGLATVLGHEVAHQVARHSAEKVSGYKVLLFGALALESLGLDAGLSRAALTLLMSLPNSRKTELEADYIGLSIMSKACFDPREASKLWQRMQASEGGGGGFGDGAKAILSTHPVHSQRIKKMEEWLPEAMSARAQSDCPSPGDVSGFRSAIDGRSGFGRAFR